MRFIGLSMAFATVCAGVVACSSTRSPSDPTGGNATDAQPPDTGVTDCSTDPLAETYASNMEQAGMAGNFKFVLVKSTSLSQQGTTVEGAPVVGTNTWTIKILDKNGAPVVGATFPPESSWPAGWPIGVYPYMPHHGHGSTSHPTVTDNMDGTYTIGGVYLFMAGLWQITINTKSGTWADSAVFGFCVQG
jgi:hypothetical protein